MCMTDWCTRRAPTCRAERCRGNPWHCTVTALHSCAEAQRATRRADRALQRSQLPPALPVPPTAINNVPASQPAPAVTTHTRPVVITRTGVRLNPVAPNPNLSNPLGVSNHPSHGAIQGGNLDRTRTTTQPITASTVPQPFAFTSSQPTNPAAPRPQPRPTEIGRAHV